jgi:uncharacterized cupredoxin-like copper-binding protein
VAAARSASATVTFSAALNARQELPHPKGTKAGASGHFTAMLTGKTLKWRLTFAHLSGRATAAHIHLGATGKSGNVIVPLCGPCTSPEEGTANVTAAEIKALENAGTYANVHTTNANGEIRGQVTRAPMRVTVTAGKPSEFTFALSQKTALLGAVSFTVTNRGALPHDFKICSTPTTKLGNSCTGKSTKLISPGASATLVFTFMKKGSYEYLCTVSGHAAAGMKGLLKVG